MVGKKKDVSGSANKPITVENMSVGSKRVYRQGHPDSPQHPARVLFTGASSSGKTNLLVNLILGGLIEFDSIYLYARNGDQEVYEDIAERVQMIEEQFNIKIPFVFESELSKVVPMDNLDKEKQNLIIFDDYVTEKESVQNTVISPFFVRSRHKNCSVYYLSQSYSLSPITIRRNVNFLSFFGTPRGRDIQLIWSDHAGDLDFKKFKMTYLNATRERYSFFTIDLINTEKKFRKGLSEILSIT